LSTGPSEAALPAPAVTIRCRANGPLVVDGPVVITDHLGNRFTIPGTKGNVALCRCGASKNKPFCDGSHRDCGFQAEQLAPAPDAAG